MKSLTLRSDEAREFHAAGRVTVRRAVRGVEWDPEFLEGWVIKDRRATTSIESINLGAYPWRLPAQPGEERWVREAHTYVTLAGDDDPWTQDAKQEGRFRVRPDGVPVAMLYKATDTDCDCSWLSAATMPKWAARSVARCVSVTAELNVAAWEWVVVWEKGRSDE